MSNPDCIMPVVELSVVIPCFNVSSYIDECLQCVLNQQLQPIEIICVDDSSTDNTVEVLSSYVKKYPGFITMLNNQGKKGAPGARNTGLAACKGNYVQFLDADDILFPEKFAHQAKILAASECKTDILVGSFSKKFINGNERLYINSKIDPWVALIDNKIGVTTANLFKRSKLEEVNGWSSDLKSSQEYDLMFKMLKAGAVVHFDEVKISYNRERASGSITKSNPKEKWRRYINLRVDIFNYLKSVNLLTPERENTFYNNIFNAARSMYRFDKASAIEFINQYLKGKRLPFNNQPINSGYVFLYNTFGFKIAQEISKIFGSRNILET